MASVRVANVQDLPAIHALMRQSFAAMNDIYGETMREKHAQRAEDIITLELNEQSFCAQYFDNPGSSFWVAVSEDGIVLGCIGVTKSNEEEGERLRAAVDQKCRSGGIGSKLMSTLLDHAIQHSIKRIIVNTANPNAMRFYRKHGFVDVQPWSIAATPDVTVHGVKMVKYLGEKLVRRVAVVGGTHGNERVGVELVKQWVRDAAPLQRPTVQTTPLLGNPAAVTLWQRYVDKDLNRQFEEGCTETESVEGARARYLVSRLGANGTDAADFLIDLHSSSSNVGVMAILCAGASDLTALRLVHHLQKHFPDLRVGLWPNSRAKAFSMDSVCPSGITFEIGPLTHGCLSQHWLSVTEKLVQLSLDYLDQRNALLLNEARSTVEISSEAGVRCYDKVVRHPSECAALREVSIDLCPHSLQPATFPPIECYANITKISYPRVVCSDPVTAFSEEEAAPLSADPMTMVLHPDMDGKDWQELEEGRPLFVSLKGDDVIVWKHEEFVPKPALQRPWEEQSHATYPAFVNEAAYQKDGIAMALFKKTTLNVY